jgi:hypothetical protein
MIRLVLAAFFSQAQPDTAAIRAAALRESPTPDSGTVTMLAVRGDTAEVSVVFERGEHYARGHTLKLARRDGRWVVLPRRIAFVRHFQR